MPSTAFDLPSWLMLLAGLGCVVLVVCVGVAIFLLAIGKKDAPERRPE